MTEQTNPIEPAAQPVTDIAALPPATRATIVLKSSQTEFDLRAMVEEAKAITEVKDKAGREQAHRLGMRLKTARTTIEKAGKSAREDAQAFSKAVIDEEKRLKAITAAEEERIFKLRDQFDAEVRAEEERRAAAEAKRVADIREKIAGIRALPLALATANSDEIQAERQALADFTPPPEVFAEFTDDCKAALAEADAALADLHAKAMARETAEKVLAAERERLAQAQREAEERAAAERARAEAAERELAALRAQLAAAQAPAPAPEPIVLGVLPAGTVVTPEVVENLGKSSLPTAEEHAAVIEGDRAALDDISPVATEPGETVPPVDWRVRMAALATADQFSALAQKVQACGFGAFANDLLAVAGLLRNGDHDSAIAKADVTALITADNAMIDASVQAVEAWSSQQGAA